MHEFEEHFEHGEEDSGSTEDEHHEESFPLAFLITIVSFSFILFLDRVLVSRDNMIKAES